MPLDIPLGTEEAGYTVVIDGRTYRPLLVDSEGRLITVSPTRSAVRAYRATTSQVIPTSTPTKIQFNAETFDALGEFDPTTNYRFTAQGAGYYGVTVSALMIELAAGNIVQCYICKNGDEYSRGELRLPSGTTILIKNTDSVYLGVGEYVEGFLSHDKGSDASVGYLGIWTYISIHRLS